MWLQHIEQLRTRSKRKHSQGWSKLETDLFYEVLGGTGTDFALMNDYITDRTRLELKKKFRHEQKTDSERVSQVGVAARC
jgi:transcription factor TFIIIB component B''